MQNDDVQRYLRDIEYEAVLSINTDKDITVYFPDRKQAPETSENAVWYSFVDGGILIDGNLEGFQQMKIDCQPYMIPTLALTLAIGVFIQIGYSVDYVVYFVNGEEVDKLDDCEIVTLDEEGKKKHKALAAVCYEAAQSLMPFSDEFETLAQNSGVLEGYNCVRRLYFGEKKDEHL